MSGRCIIDYTASQQSEDNSKMKFGNNTQYVIEQSSEDLVVSKCEAGLSFLEETANVTNNSVPVKTLVYIKNSKAKTIAVNASNKLNNNFIISPVSTANVLNKSTSSANATPLNSSQNVIIAGRSMPVVVPKQPITIVPQGTKVTGTYVTLKQLPKASAEIQSRTESLINESPADGANMVSKIILTGPISKIQSSNVITPMPTLQTTNGIPVTATTNSLQAGKFTLLPMTVPQKDAITDSNHKLFNFKISDGKIISNIPTPLTIMCDTTKSQPDSTNTISEINQKPQESIERNDIKNKTYELSIAEESLSNQSDSKLVVSSTDNSSSSMESNVVAKPHVSKFAHGISILKKNFSNNIMQDSNLVITSRRISIENDTVITKPRSGTEDQVTVLQVTAKKPEREKNRRKSQFNFRKDFDEMDMVFPDSKSPEPIQVPIESEAIKEEKLDIPEPKCEDSVIAEDASASEVDYACGLSLADVFSKLHSSMSWQDNIGLLPHSTLKFIINEFGILEFLTDDAYQKILDRKERKNKEKEDMEREIKCVACGCYGFRVDFINANFCSFDCQENRQSGSFKENQESCAVLKGHKRKLMKNHIKESNGASGEDETSNETTSQDRPSYPWACKKKGFSWSKYLMHMNAKAAPVKLFKDPFPYTRNSFKPGLKLEGVDPQHPSYFCVMTVVEVSGYRIRLHFDGYPNTYDFWTYADSMDIFPIGWCEKYGHVLHPPPGYTEETFNWVQYLKFTRSAAVPKHLFVNRAGQLEAVDKKNSSLICVASIRDMMDNRILIHFDGWDDIYDYWADPTSPYIHPVGWCDQYGHDLTAPSDYPTPETFTWEKYLKETKSVAAPVRAFKQRPVCGFKRGMRLECVDKRVPHLIRAATVDDVREHQIRIQFDGWPDRYSYWLDDDSSDIHPVGWCQKTGHPIEPPLTPDDVYDFLECPTVGCRGQGHINGTSTTHSSQKHCPYAEVNIDREKVLNDRLLSPDRSPEAKEPISRQPKDCQLLSKENNPVGANSNLKTTEVEVHVQRESKLGVANLSGREPNQTSSVIKRKSRVGRPPKGTRQLETTEEETRDEPEEKRFKNSYPKETKTNNYEPHFADSLQEEKARSFITAMRIIPAESESWRKHSCFLNDFINSKESPLNWSVHKVVEFINSIPGCDVNKELFSKHEIDGEAFLHLSQSDILNNFQFKVGPAIKLYNCIILLREQYCDRKTHN
ncbi:hypothetical protein HUJ04_001462 [Dendroctonus ponderosae]|nr:hypothetical protein HUJ04_001462 [Dendroctonus ponderosae]